LTDLPDDPQYALPRAACLIRSSEFGYYDFEAEPMIRNAREALRVLSTSPATSVAERIDAQSALAYGYYLSRDYEKADRAYAQLLTALEDAGRENTLTAAEAATNWGLVHLDADIMKAEPLLRRGLELHRSIEGVDNVAPAYLDNYGALLSQLARYDEAEALIQEAIRNARARGERRTEMAATLSLADLYTERGDLARAAAELDAVGRRADLDIPATARLRVSHIPYSRGIQSLARGNADAARDQLMTAVEQYANSGSSFSVFVFIALSRAERALGHTAAAEASARKAIAEAEPFVLKEAPSYLVGHAQAALGEAQLAAGDGEAARESLCSAIDQLDRTLGPGHPATLRARKLAEQAAAP